MKRVVLFLFCLVSAVRCGAQCAGSITTVAGGYIGFSGDGGAATSARLYYPKDVATDRLGNLFIADDMNFRVRKIDRYGVMTTIAGGHYVADSVTGDGGPATAAYLNAPWGVAADAYGNLYISETNRIRKVSTSGIITTLAGTGRAGYSGDGGAATAARLRGGAGIAVDASGNVYIADAMNKRVRKVNTSGIISTICDSTHLVQPTGVAIDRSGNVLIADFMAGKILKVSGSGSVTTFAGPTPGYSGVGEGIPATNANLYAPWGISVDVANNVYVTLRGDHRIRKIDTSGRIYTIAGTGSCCSDTLTGGPATAEDLSDMYGLAVDTVGNVYFPHLSAYGDSRIRRINAIGAAFPVVAPITGPNTVNVGNTITLADTTSGGTWRSSNASYATVNSSGVVTGVSAGLLNIKYIVSNTCGQIAASRTISVTCPLPVAATITGASVVGIGDTAALTASVAGGTWSSVSPLVASVNSRGVVTGRATGVDTIKYTLTNSCGSQVSRYILTVVTNNVQMCVGGSRTFTGTPSGGTWSSSYAPVVSITATGVAYAGRTGTILLKYVTSSSVTAWRVTVNSPILTSIGGVSALCPGSGATFTNITSGGTWSNTNTACGSISPATGVYTARASGTDSIRYSVVNGCGTIAAYKRISITAPPTVSPISGTLNHICAGRNITYTNSTLGGVWAFTDTALATIISVTSPSVTVTGRAGGSDTLTYKVTGTCGLATTVRRGITIDTLPAIGAGATCSMIIGASTTLANTVAGGSWSTVFPTIASVNATTGAVRARAAGLDTIKYRTTNLCGTSTAIYLVTVTASKPGSTEMIAELANDFKVYPNPSGGDINIEMRPGTEPANHSV